MPNKSPQPVAEASESITAHGGMLAGIEYTSRAPTASAPPRRTPATPPRSESATGPVRGPAALSQQAHGARESGRPRPPPEPLPAAALHGGLERLVRGDAPGPGEEQPRRDRHEREVVLHPALHDVEALRRVDP